ncbi:MAG TPA: cell division protein FtsA, partial [candidate division Zixibacteria bacterium]|nr:cell division protein FtsA [candidate division Zixibacteria bacterium]
MSNEQRILAALDIGATKVRAMVAQAFDDDAVYSLGYADAPSEGIRRGVIVNMDKITRVIAAVVEDAEAQANVRVDSLIVGISGDHIRSIDSQGVINVSRSDNEITASDVERAIDTTRDVAIPPDREIIHVIPQEFTVDNQTGIGAPVGMNGSRLEAHTHIVTCSSASAKNVFRALERCDLALGGLALESFAAAKSALTEEEMDLGVALVDIGGGATEIAVFKNGCIRYSGCVSLGGQNITNDIAIGLRTTVDEAERLKITHGAALASHTRHNEMIEVAASAGRPARSIARSVLATIIEARAEEILSLVGRELRRVGLDDSLAAGVTLIGAGAKLPGIVDLAEQTL